MQRHVPLHRQSGSLAPRYPPRQAFAPDTTTRNPARFLRPLPTVRRLDARQRHVPLHRHSGPFPETPRRAFAPGTHVPSALPRWTGSMSTAPALRIMPGEPGEGTGETRAGLVSAIIHLPDLSPRPTATKKPKRRRAHMERFRTNDEEHAELDRRARDAGLSINAYSRLRTLGDPGPRARRRAPVDATALARRLVAFNRQHSNIDNQAPAAAGIRWPCSRRCAVRMLRGAGSAGILGG